MATTCSRDEFERGAQNAYNVVNIQLDSEAKDFALASGAARKRSTVHEGSQWLHGS
jgi:hypothetical protein